MRGCALTQLPLTRKKTFAPHSSDNSLNLCSHCRQPIGSGTDRVFAFRRTGVCGCVPEIV